MIKPKPKFTLVLLVSLQYVSLLATDPPGKLPPKTAAPAAGPSLSGLAKAGARTLPKAGAQERKQRGVAPQAGPRAQGGQPGGTKADPPGYLRVNRSLPKAKGASRFACKAPVPTPPRAPHPGPAPAAPGRAPRPQFLPLSARTSLQAGLAVPGSNGLSNPIPPGRAVVPVPPALPGGAPFPAAPETYDPVPDQGFLPQEVATLELSSLPGEGEPAVFQVRLVRPLGVLERPSVVVLNSTGETLELTLPEGQGLMQQAPSLPGAPRPWVAFRDVCTVVRDQGVRLMPKWMGVMREIPVARAGQAPCARIELTVDRGDPVPRARLPVPDGGGETKVPAMAGAEEAGAVLSQALAVPPGQR